MKNPYNYTKGIDLRKRAPFFVSRIDGEFVFKSDVIEVYDKTIQENSYVYIPHGDLTKSYRAYRNKEFYELHRCYDYKSKDYYEVLQALERRVDERQQQTKKYSRTFDLQTYDLVADRGFSNTGIKYTR
jgi:hypothetical protein